MFKIWKRVEVLTSEDKDDLLASRYDGSLDTRTCFSESYTPTIRRNVAPGTINTWRKEYRAYLKWQKKNPSKTAEDFILELQRRKRDYRKSHPKE